MTLDPRHLEAVRAAAEALAAGEAALEPLRAAYRERLRELHAAGASLREMAAALGLSHQRMHQLVQEEPPHPAAPKPAASSPAAAARRVCGLCGEPAAVAVVASVGSAALCGSCHDASHALLAGEGEAGNGALRLLRRHQRPRCSTCGRLPGAGEAFVGGARGTVCSACLGG